MGGTVCPSLRGLTVVLLLHVGYHGQLEDSQTVPPGYHNPCRLVLILDLTNSDIQWKDSNSN